MSLQGQVMDCEGSELEAVKSVVERSVGINLKEHFKYAWTQNIIISPVPRFLQLY